MLLFFQAEDGIRDLTVTGVQTCALPIFYQNPQYYPVLGLNGYGYNSPFGYGGFGYGFGGCWNGCNTPNIIVVNNGSSGRSGRLSGGGKVAPTPAMPDDNRHAHRAPPS